MCVSARYHWRKLIGKPVQDLQLPGISEAEWTALGKMKTAELH
jgi:hypothetical protein